MDPSSTSTLLTAFDLTFAPLASATAALAAAAAPNAGAASSGSDSGEADAGITPGSPSNAVADSSSNGPSVVSKGSASSSFARLAVCGRPELLAFLGPASMTADELLSWYWRVAEGEEGGPAAAAALLDESTPQLPAGSAALTDAAAPAAVTTDAPAACQGILGHTAGQQEFKGLHDDASSGSSLGDSREAEEPKEDEPRPSARQNSFTERMAQQMAGLQGQLSKAMQTLANLRRASSTPADQVAASGSGAVPHELASPCQPSSPLGGSQPSVAAAAACDTKPSEAALLAGAGASEAGGVESGSSERAAVETAGVGLSQEASSKRQQNAAARQPASDSQAMPDCSAASGTFSSDAGEAAQPLQAASSVAAASLKDCPATVAASLGAPPEPWAAEWQRLQEQLASLQVHREWADKRIGQLIRRVGETERPVKEEAAKLAAEVQGLRAEKEGMEKRLRDFEKSLARLKECSYQEAVHKRDLERRAAAAEAEAQAASLREQELQQSVQQLQHAVKQEAKRREAAEARSRKEEKERAELAGAAASRAEELEKQRASLALAQQQAEERVLAAQATEAQMAADLRAAQAKAEALTVEKDSVQKSLDACKIELEVSRVQRAQQAEQSASAAAELCTELHATRAELAETLAQLAATRQQVQHAMAASAAATAAHARAKYSSGMAELPAGFVALSAGGLQAGPGGLGFGIGGEGAYASAGPQEVAASAPSSINSVYSHWGGGSLFSSSLLDDVAHSPGIPAFHPIADYLPAAAAVPSAPSPSLLASLKGQPLAGALGSASFDSGGLLAATGLSLPVAGSAASDAGSPFAHQEAGVLAAARQQPSPWTSSG
ncbi:hypothetical protein N2152v2_003103 [Parachlorella kessleri]